MAPEALFSINLITRKSERLLKKYPGRFETAALSSDGRFAAIGYYEFKDLNSGNEHQQRFSGNNAMNDVLIYDLETRTVVHRFDTGHVLRINKLCWLKGKPVLAIASSDNSISVWNLQEKHRMALLESDGVVGSITSLSFSADGTLLASKSEKDHLLRIRQTNTWEEIFALREMGDHGAEPSFHPSLPILASVCSEEGTRNNFVAGLPQAIRIWKFDRDAFLSNPPFMQEFHRREKELQTGLSRGEITEDLELVKVGSSPTPGIRLQRVLTGHTESIQGIAWSTNGLYLASSSNDKTIRIWNGATGECTFTLEEQDRLKHVSWTPKGSKLIYGSDRNIKSLDIDSHNVVEIMQSDLIRLDSVTYSPDGKMLAIAYGLNTIQILETSSWKEINRKIFNTRSSCRINICWSDQGRQIVVNPRAGVIQILSIPALDLIKEIVLVDRNYTSSTIFTYAVYGNKAAIAVDKRPISIINLNSGQCEKEFSEVISFVSGLNFSADGMMLVAWSHDNSIHFWRCDTWKEIAKIHEYTHRMLEPVFPSFHPHKPILATFCNKRKSLRIWDLDPGILFE